MIRDLTKSITRNSDDYNEKYMKIKFNSHDKSPLNKTIEFQRMIIQVFLDECLYKLSIIQKCYITIELTF